MGVQDSSHQAAMEVVYKKGAWSKEEDEKLIKAVEMYGNRNWVNIQKYSGLARPAKNCRLRWLNYLRPNLKKYPFTPEEENLILQLHAKNGNSWSRIAAKLPGRSDNEIKNFWHKRAKKCLKHNIPIYPANLCHHDAATGGEYFPNNNNCVLPETDDPEFQPKIEFHPTEAPSSSNQSSTDQKNQSTTAPQIQTHPPLWQGGSAPSNTSTLLQDNGQLTPTSYSMTGSTSSVAYASKFRSSPSPNSSLQMQWPMAMASPRSPQKFNLSTVAPLVCSFSAQATDGVIPMASSSSASPMVNAVLPSIQFNPVATPGASGPARQWESDILLLDQLVEAEARVRFLKKSLTIQRLIRSSEKESFSSETPNETDSYYTRTTNKSLSRSKSTESFLGDASRVGKQLVNAGANNMQEKTLKRKGDVIRISETTQDMLRIQKRDNEGGEHTEESIELKQATFQKADLLTQSSNTSQEQRHQLNLLDNVSDENRMITIKSDFWDNKTCPFQFPAGKRMKECSTTGGLFSQCSSVLLANLLEMDIFGQMSGIEYQSSSPRQSDAFGPVYSQSTATTLGNLSSKGSQITYFQEEIPNFTKRKCTGRSFMSANLSATSMLCGSNIIQQQHLTTDFQESSYMVDKPVTEYESLLCDQLCVPTSQGTYSTKPLKLNESSLLPKHYPESSQQDSSYLVGKQTMQQDSPGGEQVSPQTSGNGELEETSMVFNSTLLPHQHSASNQEDFMHLTGCFEHGHVTDEQHSTQISFTGIETTECPTIEIWNHEPSQEQSLYALLIENSWLETQVGLQDQPLLTSTVLGSDVNQNLMTQLINSNNWEGEQMHGNAGGMQKQEQEQDNLTMKPEELSSLLEFFPTTMQTLEWSNNYSGIPEINIANEKGMRQGTFHLSSSSQPPMTVADYI